MASIGPPALGAKGCVERLHPAGETTHYDLCVAGAPANHVRCASLRSGGRRLAVRKTIEYQIGALPRTPFPAAREFPSRGNEKYGEEKQRVIYFMYHSAVSPFGGERSEPITRMLNMLYDAESQSRNADFILIARRAPPQPSGPKAPSNLRTLRPRGRSILRTFPSEPSEPSEPFEPGPRSGPMPLFYA